MASCKHCSHSYFAGFGLYYEDDEKATQFLREHGVLPMSVQCPNCEVACSYREDTHIYRCYKSYPMPKRKKRRFCYFQISAHKGTFLENTRMQPWKLVAFANHFLSKHWDHETVCKGLGWCRVTTGKWWSYCSEVILNWLENQEPMGGPDRLVEIGEFLVRSKHAKGKYLTHVLLFGGIERGSSKKFVVPLSKDDDTCDKERLLPIIRRFINPGSTVICDSWRVHDIIRDLGNDQYTVNHSENVADPQDKETHTQNMEQFWRGVMDYIDRRGIFLKGLKEHLALYLFTTAHQDSLLHSFFIQVGILYPPGGDKVKCSPVDLSIDDDSDPDQPNP